MPLLPFGEYKPDISDYEGQATKNILNVIPTGDGYAPFPSFAGLSSSLPSACRGAFYALKSDGSVKIFAGTATKLYVLDNSNSTWTDASSGGSTYSQLSDSAQWQFAQTGNYVFATQANAVLQVFNLASGSAFSAALGSPPQAAYISVVGRFLVLSGLLSSPYRIQWSGLNDFNSANSWTAGLNSSDSQDFPDGGIVRGVAGGEFGTIFQDQAIRSMSYIPGSPLVFQIDRITDRLGLYAPYSIVRAGSQIFFYAGQGFFKIDPGQPPVQIGRERVDRTFLIDLDRTSLQMLIGAQDPRSSRIFWAYKSGAGAAGQFDKILGYDPVLDRFFRLSLSGEYFVGLSQAGLGITLENLDSISTSIDALPLSLDAYSTTIQPQLAMFSTSHALGFFTGSALEATVESGEQGTDDNLIGIEGFRPITDAATCYGTISSRMTQQATPQSSTERLINSRTGLVDTHKTTRYSRFKVRIPAGTTWTYAAGVVPKLVVEGEQ